MERKRALLGTVYLVRSDLRSQRRTLDRSTKQIVRRTQMQRDKKLILTINLTEVFTIHAYS